MKSEIIASRKRALFNGSLVASVAINKEGEIVADPIVTTEGVLDPNGDDELWDALFDVIYDTVEGLGRKEAKDDNRIEEALRIAIRRWCRATFSKRTVTHIHLIRV